jgi:type II secretory pathway pseudopilin PulG
MRMMNSTLDPNARRGEAGFTLVEALVAVVVLIFGLTAVTNLLLVAASANSVANQSTEATASATQVMDVLRSTPWAELAAGGDLDNDVGPATDCRALPIPITNTYHCDDVVQGVGTIKTRWLITPGVGTVRLFQISVRSEGRGALAAGRSRANFTTYRTCTQSTPGSCGNGIACCPTD